MYPKAILCSLCRSARSILIVFILEAGIQVTNLVST